MKDYRTDIDGLRSVAVLLVLFFHIDIGLFKGGFIGVDIFFTISGFLISNIVIRQIEQGKFSFKDFYIRRAVRLLPAYLFMLVVVALAGFFILAPSAYLDFLNSAFFSTVFSSNFYFWLNHGGYFSTAVHELPLLHTWSLAVEEQFYLFMPVTVLLLWKIRSQSVKVTLLVVFFILSLALSYFLTFYNPKASYFLLFSRIHEFLIGTLLAVFMPSLAPKFNASKWLSNLVFVISIAAILLTAVLLSSKGQFPGLIAAIPCLATGGLLLCGVNKEGWAYRLLSLKPLVWIGLLSYSLYLWHWPIVSFLKYIGISFDWPVQLAVVVSSFAFAAISYRLVESPCRHLNKDSKKRLAVGLYTVPASLLALAVFSALKPFALPSISQEVAALERAILSEPESGREHCHNAPLATDGKCVLGKAQGKVTSMLWGDSHASHFAPFIDAFAIKAGERVFDTTMGSCPPVLELYVDTPGARERCIAKNQAVMAYLADSEISKVYLAASWYGYTLSDGIKGDSRQQKAGLIIEHLKSTVEQLYRLGVKEVVIFHTVARTETDLSKCHLKKVMFPQVNRELSCEFAISDDQVQLRNTMATALKFDKRTRFVDVNELFCREGVCKTVVDEVPIYRDMNHINAIASRKLGTIASISPLFVRK